MRYCFVLIFCLCTLLGSCFKSAHAGESAIIFTSYFPNVVIDNPEKPGIAYEIVAEIFKEAGQPYQIVPLPWARAQYMAKHTPKSLIFPLSWTPTRDKEYKWAVNIFNNQTHFITFDGSKLTAQTARNKRIGVQLKSSWDNWLSEQGYANVYRVPEAGEELIKLMRIGRLDAWYTDQIIADTVLHDLKDPQITYSDPIQTFRTFLATHKTQPYLALDQLKEAMQKLQKSGKLNQIFEKYGISPNYQHLTSN